MSKSFPPIRWKAIANELSEFNLNRGFENYIRTGRHYKSFFCYSWWNDTNTCNYYFFMPVLSQLKKICSAVISTKESARVKRFVPKKNRKKKNPIWILTGSWLIWIGIFHRRLGSLRSWKFSERWHMISLLLQDKRTASPLRSKNSTGWISPIPYG